MRHDNERAAHLASILTAKHGNRAAPEAAERLLQWMRVGDTDIALLWVEVVKIILSMTSIAQPRLADILDEALIQATTGADNVTREDVKAVLGGTKTTLRYDA
jgi:hypothetical protein